MVAAAIVGAAVVGGVATSAASSKSSSATKSATNASIAQQDRALALQEQTSRPYRELGESAIPTLQSLLGLSSDGSAVDPQAATKTLRNLPGYQFALNEGLDATKNSASSMGLALSGNTLKALDQYSTGLADQTYQSEVGNLQNVVSQGQSAAAGQASNIGNAAANNSSALLQQGSTLASINTGAAASYNNIAQNALSQYQTQQTLKDIYGSGGTATDFYAPPRAVPAPTKG